jgi:hypothetical protein
VLDLAGEQRLEDFSQAPVGAVGTCKTAESNTDDKKSK